MTGYRIIAQHRQVSRECKLSFTSLRRTFHVSLHVCRDQETRLQQVCLQLSVSQTCYVHELLIKQIKIVNLLYKNVRVRLIYMLSVCSYINTFKYHVSCNDGKISVRINLLLYLYFPPSSHLIFLCFRPAGLSLLIHFQQVLWVLKLLLSPDLGRKNASRRTRVKIYEI